MTTPLHVDQSLDALAFLEAVAEGNELNWDYLLDTTPADQLLVGMANVAAALAQSLAAATGSPLAEVFELHRALFLHYGNPQ